MKVLALVSQKGGAGKSLLSAHLAVAFEEIGVATVVIDLDRQASISQWGDSRDAEAPTVAAGRIDRLPVMLDKAREADIDLVILDTPPHSDKTALGAISAADLVVMPTRPAIFDLRSISDTVNILKLAKKQDQALIVLNALPPRGAIGDEAEAFAKQYGIKISPIRITDRIAFAYALSEGKGITEFEPKGKGAGEIRKLRKLLSDRLGMSARKG
jgi:chromosome partitioning protein